MQSEASFSEAHVKHSILPYLWHLLFEHILTYDSENNEKKETIKHIHISWKKEQWKKPPCMFWENLLNYATLHHFYAFSSYATICNYYDTFMEKWGKHQSTLLRTPPGEK